MESPATGENHSFYRIESAEWVNVVALTRDDDLVLIRQYRHGAREITLEIPGGLVDPGEQPIEAARRELLEETGYAAARIESLGSINPNPALFANRVHMWVALDCESVAPIRNSSTEETIVERLPLRELGATVRAGRIDHALVVATLYAFELWRQAEGR